MHNGKSNKNAKVGDVASDLVGKFLGEAASKGKEALGEVIEETGDLLTEKFSGVKEKAEEWGLDEVADDIKAYVKKNPWKSVGISLAAGFLLSSILRSHKSND